MGDAQIEGNHSTMSATLGIMAIENNRKVTISGYDPTCELRLVNNVDGITTNSITITLQPRQSYVLELAKDDAFFSCDSSITSYALVTVKATVIINRNRTHKKNLCRG